MEPMKLYEQWLKDFADDAETVQDLLAIKDDPKEIEDRFYRDLEFGTAGMRGVLGAGTNRLNKYNVRRVSRALAKYILTNEGGAEKGVAIAYDSRRKSTEFAKEAALVLCAAGIRVFLYESLRPVPVLSFTVRHLRCIAGIVITASHNPAQYNGYKVYWTDGAQMPPESVKGITDRLPDTSFAESIPMDEKEALDKGLLTYIGKDVDDAYIAAVKKLSVNPELAKEMGETLKIVYTPLHGSGNLPVRRIFDEIGMKHVYVVKEQELPDGEFPTVKVPNPEDPAAFTLALQMQKELGADLCVGTDPDCDRCGTAVRGADGEYVLLSGNEMGLLLLDFVCAMRSASGTMPADPLFIKTIVTTDLAERIAASYGVKTMNVLTGFKFIGEQIGLLEEKGEEDRYVFGFEESYGYLSGTYVRDKDAVDAAFLIAEMFAYYKSRGISLQQKLDELYAACGHELNSLRSYEFEGSAGFKKMQDIMAAFRGDVKAVGGKAVLQIRDYAAGLDGLPKSDVIKFILADDCSVVVRPSGTEPKLKCYVSVTAKDRAEAVAVVEAIYSDLAHYME